MVSCCDHRSLLLYKCCGGSSQGFDDDPAYIGEHKLVLLMKAAVDYILPLARTHEMTLKKTKSAATE
jgi:hypothetical protein